MSCHVIEAEHFGYGGLGRNTGLVNAAAWLPPQDVIKQLGTEEGKKFVMYQYSMSESNFSKTFFAFSRIGEVSISNGRAFFGEYGLETLCKFKLEQIDFQ